MHLAAGRKLSHFEIRGPLGVGEMAEVYLAIDQRLGREVAIKVLPAHLADEPERLARFELEARALASVNHANIAQIYGVDEEEGTYFLALELVPGETLEERLERGPLPLDEALEVCRQIADGLAAAHAAGVVHRDLKPANIRITPEGRVKLLDFGLVKAARLARDAEWSTRCLLATGKGRLIGTPAYMAPEQARGKRVDKRIDLWALGCVLFECLSGQRAFDGDSYTRVLEALLMKEPAWDALPEATPLHVRKLLRRCLERDPLARLAHASEARRVLERPAARLAASTPRAAPRVTPGWPVVGVLALAWVASLLWIGLPGPQPATPSLEASVALAPDGSALAFVTPERRLAVQHLRRAEIVELAGTDDAQQPFFSPDGKWLGYFSSGSLWKVALHGPAPVRLCSASARAGAAWGPDGTIVFAREARDGLWSLPADGGEAELLTWLDPARQERAHCWPTFLPDGKEVLFTVECDAPTSGAGREQLEIVALATCERRPLLAGASTQPLRAAPGTAAR